MNAKKSEPRVREVEQLMEARTGNLNSTEMLQFYADLVQTAWRRTLPVLGRAATLFILERSRSIAQQSHPLVGRLQVTSRGVVFDQVYAQIENEERNHIHESFRTFVVNLFDILTLLTGDLLARTILDEMAMLSPPPASQPGRFPPQAEESQDGMNSYLY